MSAKTLIDETPPKEELPIFGRAWRWRMGMRQLLYLVFYSALVCWLLTLLSPLFVVSLIGIVVVVTMVAIIVSRRRSTQQDALAAIIAVAAEREMPLAPALDAVSNQFMGGYRRKVQTLAHYLKEGASLPVALDRVPGTLPDDAEILARIGIVVGNLAGALRESGATRFGVKPVWNAIAQRIGYFLYVLYVIQIVSGFLFYFVIPKLESILKQFEMTPPPPTLLVIQIGQVIQHYGVLYAFLLILESVVLLSLMASFTGWKRLRVPIIDRFLVGKHSALILRSLAWSVEGGYPITRGLELLMGWYPSKWIRKRLGRVIQDVKHGTNWVDSLAHHRLLRKVDASVLESAGRVGNLPWALRETALSAERRLAYRLQIVLQLLTPIVLLALGLVVALLAVAYFAPLIKIIERLS
ncbi:type II secretion system F family protein [Singulisphaera acidiphila]|uniref:Type II secretory pathway, component PulF n=1 Tax=Singulisphaera acidiphila (strain ATCC BAA-1392 / DSM 18658 / VKM B-2454 / MOB10) TaxID=886293 RepID=L0DM53_SINAD|nr:type II secretion system F family protein [Singulisphaera acidiphila]AGA30459.1 type II secretory pathway, component PulF [Singulisphaera acidiphila DSM 18658]